MKKDGGANSPQNAQIVKESISVKGSKSLFQQRAAAAAEPKTSGNKAVHEEIIRARAGRDVPVSPPVASSGPVAPNTPEDAAARKARKAAFEARFASPGQHQVVKTTEKDAVFATLRSPEHKARFAANKESIVKFSREKQQAMHKDARSRVMQLLNIESVVIPQAQAQVVQRAPAPVAAKASAPMQLISMQNMFVAANPQGMVTVSGTVASKSAVSVSGAVAKQGYKLSESASIVDEPEFNALNQVAFGKILNFNFLHDARIVAVPVGDTIDEDNIKEKLEEFMQIVFHIDEDLFLTFLNQHQGYDRKLAELQAAAPQDRPGLAAEFQRITAEFRQRFDAIIVTIVEAVSNMSMLVAYLENNPQAGVNVYAELCTQYEDGHDVMVQMKKVLIEKCSNKICQLLELRNSDDEGLAEKIKSTLLNQACAQGDERRIGKYL